MWSVLTHSSELIAGSGASEALIHEELEQIAGTWIAATSMKINL
jgi:hypothetical protein